MSGLESLAAGYCAPQRSGKKRPIPDDAGQWNVCLPGVPQAFMWTADDDRKLILEYTDSAVSVEIVSLESSGEPQVLGIRRVGGQWPTLAVGAW